ncbi:MAG TPA: ATP-binding protein [Candidatus Acidoferrales bacterium]|nr:ATP-binding protein [Candidatus Acidoferrales bacterium]
MKTAMSLRVRMMLLFCVAVGILLAGSYTAFYLALRSVVRSQFNQRLMEAEAPVSADLQTDADNEDIVALDIPGEYFEVLDSAGRAVARSKNLAGHTIEVLATGRNIRTVDDPKLGRLHIGVATIHRASGDQTLILAMPTGDIEQILTRFRALLFILFPLSLLIMGALSAWYVGRSLKPIAALTQETSRMAERVKVAAPGVIPAREPLNPLPLAAANRDDELGRLAEAFNKLFVCMEGALTQLRQFVSDASHELRTPLSVLQGETELLLKEPRAPEEYQRALEVIDSELKKMSRIVEGLFTLAMADAGQLRLLREPLYLNEVLEEACVLATPRARTKGIAIERQLSRDVPCVGDETFLRQLFLIFLDNAVKYSKPQSRIRVGLAPVNGKFEVEFDDQGAGISPEHLPHIFERFYRVTQPDAPEAQSGGLGLAIAQAIVGAQGGAIECASKPGEGSKFVISLPRDSEGGQQRS